MISFFGLDRQYVNLTEELLEATDNVLSSGQLMTGEHTEAFELWLAKKNHSKYAITCHSGTQALEMIVHYLFRVNHVPDLHFDVPTLTFPATINAILNKSKSITLIDSDVNGQNIAHDYNSKINTVRMVVGLYGESIPSLVNNANIIEDAAQHWLSNDCKRVGLAAAISFDPTKNLPNSGNGGAIITNDKELHCWVKSHQNHGKGNAEDILGTNSRMSELDCAHLLVRSNYIDDWQNRRRQIAQYYCDNFENTRIRPLIRNFKEHSFQKFVIDVDNRDDVLHKLRGDDIDCKIHYEKPLHEYKKYSVYKNPGLLSTASSLCRRIISLPIYPELKNSEVEYITERVLHHTSH